MKPVSSIENAVLVSSSLRTDSIADAIDQAIAQLKKDDFHTQWESAKQLSRQLTQWGDYPVPYLIDRLQTATDPDVQWFLVRILSQFEQIEVIEAIAQLLTTTQNEDLQTEVCKALTRIGRNAIDTVSGLLSSNNPIERRIRAVRVLAHIRRSATIEPLLGVANDDNAEIRSIAIEALGSFHDPRITPVLLSALEEGAAKADASICVEAIRTLGRRSDLLPQTDLVGPLQRCLLDDNPRIARESAIALGRLGTEKAVTALDKALMQPIATPVKVAIVRALGWIDSDRAVQSLAIALRQSAPLIMPTVKPEIARALGQTHDPGLKPQAAQPLVDWLQTSLDKSAANDPNPNDFTQLELTQAIVSALAQIGETTSITALIPLLASSDSRIKIHVLSALRQIDPGEAKAQLQQYLTDKQTSNDAKKEVEASLRAW